MPLLVSMREVEPEHVQAGIEQLPEVLLAPAGGPGGADDLGLAGKVLLLLKDHAEGHMGGALRVHIGGLLRRPDLLQGVLWTPLPDELLFHSCKDCMATRNLILPLVFMPLATYR